MKYLSLFSGIGGFEKGIEEAYATIRNTDVQKKQRRAEAETRVDEKRSRLHAISSERTLLTERRSDEYAHGSFDERQPTCIGFSEIDKYATAIYKKHFPNHVAYGDITKIDTNDLPDFDLLVGGFPCQAFSIAGKRGGFDDTRGTLFFEIARIAREKQPRLLLLENVKGLLSHDEGRTFRTIIATLDELGYDLQWQIINSKNHGVPQNRERIFIIGHLRGTPRPEVFPLGGADGEDIRINELTGARKQGNRIYGDDGIAPSVQSAFGTGGTNTPNILQLNQPRHSNDRVYGAGGISPTLNTMQGGNRQPFVLTGSPKYTNGKREVEYKSSDIVPTVRATQYKSGDNQPRVVIPEATKKGYAEATVGQSINLAVPNSKTRRGRVSDIAQTLDTGMQQHTLTNEARIRRLTPTECERLQGFPDFWTAKGVNEQGEEVEISDTQRYKTLGNAVTTNVIRDIMIHLL